jgi:hypothetical protein
MVRNILFVKFYKYIEIDLKLINIPVILTRETFLQYDQNPLLEFPGGRT